MKTFGQMLKLVGVVGIIVGTFLLFQYRNTNIGAVLERTDIEDWISVLYVDFKVLFIGLIAEILGICFFFIGKDIRQY